MSADSLAPELRLAPTQKEHGQAAPLSSGEVADALLDREFSPEVKAMIGRMLDGSEPQGESDGRWRHEKFMPHHINVVVLRAAGFRIKDIAQALGITPVSVSQITAHPYAKKLIAALVPRNSAKILDIRTRMEVYASDLLDQTFEMASKSEDLEVVSKVGFGLLDRIGHGPIGKSVSANVPASAFPDAAGSGGDHKTLGRLADALEESNRLDKEIMPVWKAQRPPEEGSLPASSEIGLDGPGGHEVESVVPSSPPTSEAAD